MAGQARRIFLSVGVASGLIFCSLTGRANAQIGSALTNNAKLHQTRAMQAGIDDIQRRADKATVPRTLKDVSKGLDDADPKVRVESLTKLRYLQDPKVNDLLFRGLADADTRVKIKAIDILGARQTNDAVPMMSQYLFLRSTEPAVKLHIVAALGRVGDARGTLPVMQYLLESQDERSRGTAVFALGEIADMRASDVLAKTATEDQSTMVRRLAQEALEKVDGELPTARKVAAKARDRKFIPTDERLSKLRQMDAELHQKR